jgi:hypothetical protein
MRNIPRLSDLSFDKFLENGIKLISLLTVGFILLGNLYIYAFYKSFGLNIYSCIQPSEVIYLFLPAFYDISSALVRVLIAPYFLWIAIMVFINFKLKQIPNTITRTLKKHKYVRNLYFYSVLLYFACALFFSYKSSILSEGSSIDAARLYYWAQSCSAIALLIYALWAIGTLAKAGYRHFVQFLCFILVLAISIRAINQTARYDAFVLKEEVVIDKVYTISLKDSTIVTNYSIRVIGITGSNIVLYKKGTNQEKTIVLNKSDLIRPLEIKYSTIKPYWKDR